MATYSLFQLTLQPKVLCLSHFATQTTTLTTTTTIPEKRTAVPAAPNPLAALLSQLDILAEDVISTACSCIEPPHNNNHRTTKVPLSPSLKLTSPRPQPQQQQSPSPLLPGHPLRRSHCSTLPLRSLLRRQIRLLPLRRRTGVLSHNHDIKSAGAH